VGRIGSGVWVVSVFNQNALQVLSYDVLRQQKTGVTTKAVVSGGVDLLSGIKRRARHKHFIVVFCVNNGRQTPRCALRLPPSIAALFFTVCDSYS